MLAIRNEIDRPHKLQFSFWFSLDIINGFIANQNMMVYVAWKFTSFNINATMKLVAFHNCLKCRRTINSISNCAISPMKRATIVAQLIWFHVIWSVRFIVSAPFVRVHIFFKCIFIHCIYIVCTQNVYTLTNVFDARDNDRHIMFIPTMTYEMIDR